MQESIKVFLIKCAGLATFLLSYVTIFEQSNPTPHQAKDGKPGVSTSKSCDSFGKISASSKKNHKNDPSKKVKNAFINQASKPQRLPSTTPQIKPLLSWNDSKGRVQPHPLKAPQMEPPSIQTPIKPGNFLYARAPEASSKTDLMPPIASQIINEFEDTKDEVDLTPQAHPQSNPTTSYEDVVSPEIRASSKTKSSSLKGWPLSDEGSLALRSNPFFQRIQVKAHRWWRKKKIAVIKKRPNLKATELRVTGYHRKGLKGLKNHMIQSRKNSISEASKAKKALQKSCSFPFDESLVHIRSF